MLNTLSNELRILWAPIPHTNQGPFFDDDTPEAKILLAGGYGSGKTMTLCAKALKLSALNDGLPGIFTVPDYDHFEKTVLPTLTSLDPETDQPWFLDTSECHYHLRRHVFEWIGGGEWHVHSAKYPESIKGPNMSWGAMDEPGIQTYEAWRNTVNRVRHPRSRLRQVVAAGTFEGLNWFAEQFSEELENHVMYRLSTRENVELLRWQPTYIQQVLQNATEAEARSYIGGEIANLTGAMAYPSFSRATHWRTDVDADPDLPLRISFDFNVDPMACIIGQIVPGGQRSELNVVDAVVIPASWTPEVCERIIARYGKRAHPRHPRGWPAGCIVYGDATGHHRSTTSKHTNYDLIRERLAPEFPSFQIHHSVLTRMNPPENDRLHSVNVLLKDAKNRVGLWIKKSEPIATCPTRELVRSLEMTIVMPGTNKVHKSGKDTVSHAADALGYLVHAEFPAKKPTPFGLSHFHNTEI